MPRAATRQVMTATHKQSPTKLSMNDDRGEKVARLQSRQALQEMHMNDMRAAASPMRKMNQRNRPSRDSDASMQSSPYTPRASLSGNQKAGQRVVSHTVPLRGDGPGELDVRNATNSTMMTPMKRMPILANFEEWMKLATDNKINATNSWNFALIDYFHDMSLLKEGDGVNFQKASCTLDGCVKIYTSRVDSVATETGRLLSGLADSAEEGKKKRGKGDAEDDGEEGDEGEDEDEDGEGKKKSKKKTGRSHEATLAPGFASLQLKKLELEFAVDPLFKKASADFDEGGAKGLLLNHLSIDSAGRIVFDSSDDAGDAALSAEPAETQHNEQEEDDTDSERRKSSTSPEAEQQDHIDEEIDLEALGGKFFPDLTILDAQDVCPSMKAFALGDPSSDLNMPFLKAPGDWRDLNKAKAASDPTQPPLIDGNLNLADQSGFFVDGSNGLDFDDDDEGGFALDMPDNVGFGEGGEAWARDAAVDPATRVIRAEDGAMDDNLIDGDYADGYTIALQHKYREDTEQETMMAFFGKAFNSRAKVGTKAFQNLTNWRIQKIQKQAEAEHAPPARQRKEKEPFEIDFLGPISDNLKKLLEAEPANNSAISLPKTQLKTKGRNLLDKDDELIDVKAMMRLWTKPKCRVGKRKGGVTVIDEGFGARGREQPRTENYAEDEEDDGRKGDYDANFFADDEPIGLPFDGPLPIDEDDDDDGLGMALDEQGFVDAREMLSPAAGSQQPLSLEQQEGQSQGDAADPFALAPPVSQLDLLPGSFGAQLVTQQGRRLRPEYVNFARTAKKVDVRKLKERMWDGMSDCLNIFAAPEPKRLSTPALTDGDGDSDMAETEPTPEQEIPQEQHSADTEKQESQIMKFTQILSDLRSVYPEQQMKDISTSYGFICLLHLANEKGLVLEGGREDGTMNEILVRRDDRIGADYVGE